MENILTLLGIESLLWTLRHQIHLAVPLSLLQCTPERSRLLLDRHPLDPAELWKLPAALMTFSLRHRHRASSRTWLYLITWLWNLQEGKKNGKKGGGPEGRTWRRKSLRAHGWKSQVSCAYCLHAVYFSIFLLSTDLCFYT